MALFEGELIIPGKIDGNAVQRPICVPAEPARAAAHLRVRLPAWRAKRTWKAGSTQNLFEIMWNTA